MSAAAGADRRSPWVVGRPASSARFRLYCFPHSGGASGEYVRWADFLPGVGVLAIHLPGRGRRLADPAFTRMDPLVDALLEATTFVEPFALFGHSFGALLAHRTADRLRELGREAPACLFLSAQGPPHLPRQGPPLHDQPDAVLARAMAATLPPDLRSSPEMLAQALTAYRADRAVGESYRLADPEPLGCPIVVTGGLADSWDEAELAQWRRYTTAAFRVRLLPGDHFYLRRQRAALLWTIADSLAELT